MFAKREDRAAILAAWVRESSLRRVGGVSGGSGGSTSSDGPACWADQSEGGGAANNGTGVRDESQAAPPELSGSNRGCGGRLEPTFQGGPVA
jgi:hypothetical protein